MSHEPPATSEFLFPEEVFRIRGAVFEVNRELGAGFLESVYQECLAIEFSARGIPFVAHPSIGLTYKGRALAKTFIPDFVCFERIVVELKAVGGLAAEHRAQLINYLRASGMRLGLLINFGCSPKAQIERLAL